MTQYQLSQDLLALADDWEARAGDSLSGAAIRTAALELRQAVEKHRFDNLRKVWNVTVTVHSGETKTTTVYLPDDPSEWTYLDCVQAEALLRGNQALGIKSGEAYRSEVVPV